MQIRKLTMDQMESIYQTDMQEAFPPAELKPWKRICQMAERGVYTGYGLYEEDPLKAQKLGRNLRAYGFFVRCPGTGDLLLDYLSVPKSYRGEGYGSQFLSYLPDLIGDSRCLLFEIEDPDCTDDPDVRKTRLKRQHFYLKNGIRATNARSQVFGVDYRILQYTPDQPLSEAEVMTALTEVYHTMFPEEWFGKQVFIL